MKVYHIKARGKRPDTYVLKDWTTSIDEKNNRLTYFVRGLGYQKSKMFEELDIDVSPVKDAMYIGRIYSKYGRAIATRLCEEAFGCCTLSAESRVISFGHWYDKAHAVLSDDEIDSVPLIIKNNLRSIPPFVDCLDVIYLDDALASEDIGYDNINCDYHGVPNVSMQVYIDVKFGDTATKFIEAIMK